MQVTGTLLVLMAGQLLLTGVGGNGLVFTVADPTLDIKIWDFIQAADVTGKSVPQGQKLGFRIDTNMYPAVNAPSLRNNVVDQGVNTYVQTYFPDNTTLATVGNYTAYYYMYTGKLTWYGTGVGYQSIQRQTLNWNLTAGAFC